MKITPICDLKHNLDRFQIGEARVAGWVDTKRNHGKITFIDLRDNSGAILQVVGWNALGDLDVGDVVSITGEVKKRPPKMVNPNISTGDIELAVKTYEVLNKVNQKHLAIPSDGDGYDISEDMRLRYRYLDIRRARLQYNLKLRSKLLSLIRNSFSNLDFTEVETPLLTKSTKEGARDFIVPSRVHPGYCYALPQSPQQYKQLLMVGGIDKYYQIARCVRDEDPRADRGFEFTQLDMEMSFVEHESEVLSLIEKVVRFACENVGRKIVGTANCQVYHGEWESCHFPIFTYAEAMDKFKTDKPDIRTDEEKERKDLGFAWIVRFPMFKKAKESVDKLDSKSGWTFMHNPFSIPIAEHREWLLSGKNISDITACQYDLVCNGLEIGSGSLRSHQSELLKATYKVMGYSDKETYESVGHMLEAFDCGAPPHGGIALGIDRLAMLCCNETSMKEVVAFPTTNTGRTSIMDAPCPIRDEQKEELQWLRPFVR